MFKKTLIIGSLALAAIFSGCADDADVAVDETATTTDGGSTYDDSTAGNDTAGSNVSSTSGDSTDYGPTSYATGSSSLLSIYFGFDRFIIEGARNNENIKNNSRLINDSGNNVVVEGNTDEWGSDEYNYALALKRATSVKDALLNNGVAENKIKVVSYGESKPRCTDQVRECWKENRRVDFALEN